MKLLSILTLAGLAMGFVLPTLAQEQNTVDPEVRRQIEAVGMQVVEAYNKHDAAAASAALYAQEAVRMGDVRGGLLVGREAIEKAFAADFAGSFPPRVDRLVQMYAFEDRIVTISEWSSESYHGHTLKVYVRDADTWKIGMELITAAVMAR